MSGCLKLVTLLLSLSKNQIRDFYAFVLLCVLFFVTLKTFLFAEAQMILADKSSR